MTLPYDAPTHPGEQGCRIREERLRLGMTEAEFGEVAGLGSNKSKNANLQRVRALETNSNSNSKPLSSTDLSSMATIGVDVQYVLVGQRSQVLSPEEQALVDNYRASSEADRKSLRSVGNAFAQSRLNDDGDAVAGGD